MNSQTTCLIYNESESTPAVRPLESTDSRSYLLLPTLCRLAMNSAECAHSPICLPMQCVSTTLGHVVRSLGNHRELLDAPHKLVPDGMLVVTRRLEHAPALVLRYTPQ